MNVATEGNVLLRRRQYYYNSLNIARRLIENKIQSQMRTLQKIRKKDERIKITIKSLKQYRDSISSKNVNDKELLGLEGIASRIYFQALFRDFEWQARRPRAKMDITNCLLDIGYTLLFNFIESCLAYMVLMFTKGYIIRNFIRGNHWYVI